MNEAREINPDPHNYVDAVSRHSRKTRASYVVAAASILFGLSGCDVESDGFPVQARNGEGWASLLERGGMQPQDAYACGVEQDSVGNTLQHDEIVHFNPCGFLSGLFQD